MPSVSFRSADPSPDRDALVRQAQVGDSAAFGAVVRMTNDRVADLAYRLGIPISDIEDVTQDVWIKAWRRLPGFKWEANFSTWIYRVTYNTVIDRGRAYGRRPQTVGFDEREPETYDPMDQVVVAIDQRNEVRALLDLLNDKYRAALVLSELDDLSDREAAQILGISTKAFSSRLERARTTLMKLLPERPEGERE